MVLETAQVVLLTVADIAFVYTVADAVCGEASVIMGGVSVDDEGRRQAVGVACRRVLVGEILGCVGLLCRIQKISMVR